LSGISSVLSSLFKEAKEGNPSKEDFSGFDPRIRAPNAIEWCTGPSYLNSPSLFQHVRQYQVIRDFFQLRCPICNSRNPNDIDCWGKGQEYFESESLLIWSPSLNDDVCPKCRNTRQDFFHDKLMQKYNTLIGVAGMRSGKSVVSGYIATYVDSIIVNIGSQGRGALQKAFNQLNTQTFEFGFAATTATQTEATIYDVYRELRAESPWFKKYVDWVKTKEKAQSVPPGVQKWEYKELDSKIEDEFLRVNYVALNKNSAGLAGRTRIAIFIDELARFGTTESALGAEEVWHVLFNSLKTLKKAAAIDPVVPYWLGLAISTSSPISITDKQWQLMSSAAEIPSYFAFHYATWEFNPHFTKEDFKEEYTSNPVKAERDFGANPPAAANPLIDDVKRFWQAIDWNLKPLANFVKTVPKDKTGREYVGLSLEHAQIDRRSDRFIRVDAGKSFDAFAIACAHGEWVRGLSSTKEQEEQEIVPFNSEDGYYPEGNEREQGGYFVGEDTRLNTGVPKEDLVYVTVFDFLVRILAEKKPKRTVWFDSICSIVKVLTKYIHISQVIFDQWNSESSIQSIRDYGILSDIEHLKVEDYTKFLNDSNSGKVRLLPPLPSDKLEVSEEGIISIGCKMADMSGQGAALLELLKLEMSPDLKKIYNPEKGRVLGENSNDLAQVLVGAHRQVQMSLYSKANTKIDKLKRSRMGGQMWGNRGGIFRLSRWT
jgi:hypothetical protein